MPRKGFTSGEFTTIYNSFEKSVIKDLAAIEKADANRCSECGGEDCICCEIYHDRQKWVSSSELFSEYDDVECDDMDEEEIHDYITFTIEEICEEHALDITLTEDNIDAIYDLVMEYGSTVKNTCIHYLKAMEVLNDESNVL